MLSRRPLYATASQICICLLLLWRSGVDANDERALKKNMGMHHFMMGKGFTKGAWKGMFKGKGKGKGMTFMKPRFVSTPAVTFQPTDAPTAPPSIQPTTSSAPSFTATPTFQPTPEPTSLPTRNPTSRPTGSPTTQRPTGTPTSRPTGNPTVSQAPTFLCRPAPKKMYYPSKYYKVGKKKKQSKSSKMGGKMGNKMGGKMGSKMGSKKNDSKSSKKWWYSFDDDHWRVRKLENLESEGTKRQRIIQETESTHGDDYYGGANYGEYYGEYGGTGTPYYGAEGYEESDVNNEELPIVNAPDYAETGYYVDNPYYVDNSHFPKNYYDYYDLPICPDDSTPAPTPGFLPPPIHIPHTPKYKGKGKGKGEGKGKGKGKGKGLGKGKMKWHKGGKGSSDKSTKGKNKSKSKKGSKMDGYWKKKAVKKNMAGYNAYKHSGGNPYYGYGRHHGYYP